MNRSNIKIYKILFQQKKKSFAGSAKALSLLVKISIGFLWLNWKPAM